MKQIIKHLKNSHRVLVVSHKYPDGDAIGSLVALGQALELSGKITTLYDESAIPAVYRFIPTVKQIVRHIKRLNYDMVFVLDCSDWQRIGKRADMIKQVPVIINIDHHITNTFFGHHQLIDSSACATAEIVYYLIQHMGVTVDKTIATAIYTGILTDTGSFRFPNTNSAAFEICQKLMETGVNPYNIAQHVYGSYSLGRIQLLNHALNSIEISDNGRLSVMTLTREMFDETNTHPEDVDGMINYARRIEEVKVAALIQEHVNDTKNSGRFHVSLRSDGTVDVADIASAFGGGGHSNAAGFSIESTLAGIKAEILNLAKKI